MRLGAAAVLGSSLLVLIAGSSGPAYAGLTTSPVWTGNGFGQTLAVTDINGDGYADIVLGSPYVSGTSPKPWSGQVTVYLGSANGPSTTPSQQLINPSSNPTSEFGFTVAAIGDFNGDGFNDVAIAEIGYQDKGAVHIYFGSRRGLPNSPSLTVTGDAASCCGFGQTVSGADVNGDGMADLIVGNPYFSNNQGQASVYYGTRARRMGPPAWTYVGAANQFLLLGNKVAGAGDVNHDGFGDFMVAVPGFVNNFQSGEVLLFLGSAHGPAASPSWTAVNPTDGVFGNSLASAGDVNADGYDDILIGNNQASAGGDHRGEVLLYYGSASGPGATPDWTVTGDVDGCLLGFSVASAGDVNGDGFDDMLVGAPSRIQSTDQRGRAYLYLGGAASPSTTPDWFFEGEFSNAQFGWDLAGGDVNGDHRSDAIVGGINYGAALLFLGQP